MHKTDGTPKEKILPTTASEIRLCAEIGKRAARLACTRSNRPKQISTQTRRNRYPFFLLSVMMDIEACHNGNPLMLAELLNADVWDFAHDVFGIQENIDRTTGKLMNCFVPRYSVRTQ